MTTLNGEPEAAPRSAPPPTDPTKPDLPAAAARPTAPAEILPMLVESPAWPRVFPGL